MLQLKIASKALKQCEKSRHQPARSALWQQAVLSGWLMQDAFIVGMGYLTLTLTACIFRASLLWIVERGKSILCKPEESRRPA